MVGRQGNLLAIGGTPQVRWGLSWLLEGLLPEVLRAATGTATSKPVAHGACSAPRARNVPQPNLWVPAAQESGPPSALHAQGVPGDPSPPMEVVWHSGTVQPGHALGDDDHKIRAVLAWGSWGHCASVGAGPHLPASVTDFPPAPHPAPSLLLSQEWGRRGLPGGSKVSELGLYLLRGDYAL